MSLQTTPPPSIFLTFRHAWMVRSDRPESELYDADCWLQVQPSNFELNEASFFMGISHIVYAPIPEHVFIALRAALAHWLEAWILLKGFMKVMAQFIKLLFCLVLILF